MLTLGPNLDQSQKNKKDVGHKEKEGSLKKTSYAGEEGSFKIC